MNRHSLFLRLFLGNLLVVGLVVIVAGVVSYRSLNTEYQREVFGYQDQMASVAQQYAECLWSHTPAELNALCKQFPKNLVPPGEGAARRLPIRLTLVAKDGLVLGDSEGDPATMVNHKTADRPELMAALDGRPGQDVRHSETLAVEFRYVALPVRQDGNVVGAARVAMPVVAVVEAETVLRQIILWTVVAAVAAFALVGLLMNWIWYIPLRRLTQAARRIAAGDLDHRVRIGGSAELAHMAQALNAMRLNLAAHIKTVTEQRESLGQVIASLREGLIAVDAAGQIVLANRAATDLLAVGDVKVSGRSLEAVVRTAAILDVYNAAMADRRPIGRQVEAEIRGVRRHLDVQVEPLTAGAEGIIGLIVVRDVTDLVRAAAMKAEFVANASHELRTPLATLRAAVESLAATDPGDHESVVKLTGMLERHVKRLENLTLDLLDLHAVETAKRELAFAPIRLESLTEWAASQFSDRAAKKGVELEIAAVPPDGAFTSDRAFIELILRNLLDNAMKFTPSGGRVMCAMRQEAGAVRLTVTDTGIGISRADQPRVFERFFQVDSARSGETSGRGTGLGLAIVKHACDRLGATISLESELGQGTTVTVRVPDRVA
jgi:two-component system, OmpR family, phosphate regulon sensor histidine kinase PhoR